MINTFFGAKLVDYNTIRISIFSEVNKDPNTPFYLIIDSEEVVELQVTKQSFLSGLCLYECKTKNKVELGKRYVVQCRDFGSVSLNVNDATFFKDFDEDYYYDGDDLGATYSKEETTFKVWAPLASKVSLFIRKNDNEIFTTYKLKRGDKGVYSITLKGDFEKYLYRYLVTNSGMSLIVTDPYAKGSTANGKNSVVVDLNKCKVPHKDLNLPKYNEYSETIIYELDVRDFTVDKSTNIVNKGKYLGLTELNKTTKKGHKAGIDYIEDLGPTHVQLLPIYDFKTIDELDCENSYNWGYDPQQYFVPEGSYSLDPNDAYSRIIECKKMIEAFHEKGIKVNMDVVFNHVYNYEFSTFERIVPNFYFRKNKNQTLCNGSGCGNDLDTSRKMVRKLIIDSLKYWMNEYNIDGFRFDLMGLIDLDTMKEVVKECRKIKSDAMIYGEGWDMQTNLPHDKKTSIYNSFKVPEIGFFNDTFRDIVRGNNDIKAGCYGGYMLGNMPFLEGFKFSIIGSSTMYCYQPRFINSNQSINYLECHDNCALFDKVSEVLKTDDEKVIMRVINSLNATILLSLGVPFIHAGQEIGLTKFKEDNTYNKGDKYNKFNYKTLDDRYEHFLYVKSLIELRKKGTKEVKLFNSLNIEDRNEFINLDNGCLAIKLISLDSSEKEYIIVYNPTDEKLELDFDSYYRLIVGDGGYLKESDIHVKNVVIEPRVVNAFIKE